ncbi:MAG: hypothetical protein AB1758_25740, partial [Candidatus Eremiobacterota bacterium]
SGDPDAIARASEWARAARRGTDTAALERYFTGDSASVTGLEVGARRARERALAELLKPGLPGNEDGVAVEKSMADPARLARLRRILEATPEGRRALEIVRRYNTRVEFGVVDRWDGQVPRDSQGRRLGIFSYFDPSTNKVVLFPYRDEDSSLMALVHEAAHAEAAGSGRSPRREGTDPDRYQRLMYEEEAEGYVRAFEALQQLNRAPENSLASGFYQSYRTAYVIGVRELVRRNPSATEAERHEAGRKSGLSSLTNRIASQDRYRRAYGS